MGFNEAKLEEFPCKKAGESLPFPLGIPPRTNPGSQIMGLAGSQVIKVIKVPVSHPQVAIGS